MGGTKFFQGKKWGGETSTYRPNSSKNLINNFFPILMPRHHLLQLRTSMKYGPRSFSLENMKFAINLKLAAQI